MVMRRIVVLALLVLGMGAPAAPAQYVPYPGDRPTPLPTLPPRQAGYWVQFRQPYWRSQEFRSEAEAVNFIENQQALGWDVQMMPPNRGRFVVRYRLMQWGGSRVYPDLADAQRWAAQLEQAGFEPRVVDNLR